MGRGRGCCRGRGRRRGRGHGQGRGHGRGRGRGWGWGRGWGRGYNKLFHKNKPWTSLKNFYFYINTIKHIIIAKCVKNIAH